MNRFVVLLASLLLSTQMMGCAEQAPPPAGKMTEGPDTGPPTKGLAAKDRERMFKQMDGVTKGAEPKPETKPEAKAETKSE